MESQIVAVRSARIPPQVAGSLLAMGAALVWSVGALSNRWADSSDAWQYLLWRSVGIIVGTQMVAWFRRDSPPIIRAWNSGPLMITASFGLIGASLGFVYALKNTTAANASFFASLSPFVAALIAYFLLKERFGRSTYLAMLIAGLGVLVLAFGPSGGSQGDGLPATMKGNVAALLCSFGFAVYVICLRQDPHRDWSPAMPGYCSMLSVLCIAVIVANGQALIPARHDVVLAMVHGGVIIVVGTSMFNHATKSVSSVGLAVLAQVETIAVPLMVLLVFNEVPSPAATFGGLLILAGVVVQAIGQSRAGMMVSAAEAEHGV